jgi:LysR family transcriptional regulator, glycine cleavage system transcriptional activator
MGRRDYPLNALKAFEASARHSSFVRAADELHVTPAAISHQIKRLEEYLRMPLFRRLSRGLLLTEPGQSLVSDLRDVFAQLDAAIERVVDSDARGALTISVAPVFAVKWLLPRLQRFGARNPDIDVRMSASIRVVDFRHERFDLAVRLGRGHYAGLESTKLFDESVTPICSPRLLQRSRRWSGGQRPRGLRAAP